MRDLSAVALLGLLSSLVPREASASETLLLRYRAPVECPAGAAFRDEVQALLKNPDDAPRHVPVEVVIEGETTAGYQLQLQLPNGERSLDGAQCADLVSAAALFVALLLEDPEFTPAAPEPIPEPEPEPEPDPAPEPDPTRFFMGASGGLSTGTLPRTGPAAALHFGVLVKHAMFEARVLGTPPQKTNVAPGRSLDTALFGGSLRGCHRTNVADVVYSNICGGMSAGALFASSPEILTQGEAAPAFVNADFGSNFWWLVERSFAISVGAELTQPLLVPAVYLRGGEEPLQAHKAGTSFRGLLGMRWIF